MGGANRVLGGACWSASDFAFIKSTSQELRILQSYKKEVSTEQLII